MANLCGHCIFLDPDDCSWGKYYCRDKKTRVSVDDRACSSFRKIGSTPDNEYQRAGCYITTIVCEILGYGDNAEVLQILRQFRDCVLKANVEYYPILWEYDQVGPLIADFLRMENNNKRLAMELLQGFIIPCTVSIKGGNVEEAISIYTNMVNFLKSKFGLENTVVNYSSDIPLEELGKGRYRGYAKSEC